jgi:tetratricopeptide (TPR) repeat protein
MENKAGLKKATRIIIICWAAAAFFAFLFIAATIENIKLKNSLAIERHQLTAFKDSIDEYERLKTEKEKWDTATVDYLDWQFVLKDQLTLASVKIMAAINSIDNVKNNKDLANLLYYNLGLAYMMSVDFDSAIKYFKTATDLRSADADSWYNLGLLYSTFKNNPREAEKCYSRFLALVPGSPKATDVKSRIEALRK